MFFRSLYVGCIYSRILICGGCAVLKVSQLSPPAAPRVTSWRRVQSTYVSCAGPRGAKLSDAFQGSTQGTLGCSVQAGRLEIGQGRPLEMQINTQSTASAPGLFRSIPLGLHPLYRYRFCHRALLQKTFLHGVIMSVGFYQFLWFHYLPFHLCIQVRNVILHGYKVIISSP